MGKKGKLLVLLAGLLVIMVLAERYVAVEFNVNLLQTLTGRNKITPEERAWLNRHGSIIYGADQNSPPLRFVDESDGQYRGVVVDYVRALSIELESQIEFRPMVWSLVLTELAHGRTDVCDMFPSKERGKYYLFTDPIYNMRGLVLISNHRKDLIRPENLAGLRVAAPKGDYAVGYLKKKAPSIVFSTPPDMRDALKLLKNRQVDAVAGDEPVISHFLEVLDMEKDYSFMDQPLYELGTVLAVPKSEPVLQAILNKGIQNLNSKQIVAKIQQKWFGISTPLIQEQNSEKIIILSLVFTTMIVMIIYLFMVWNQLLRGEVDKRTRQLLESRNSLQTTFDSLKHFMVVVDSKCTIINLNRSFCRYASLSRERIIGRSCHRFGPVFDNPIVAGMIQKTIAGAFPERSEFKVGEQIYIIRTFPIADPVDDAGSVLCMIIDVTREKENEKQLFYANKMSTVGRLAAGVTHEIRNPLGLIRNHCYVLKKKLSKMDNDEKRSIEVIESAVIQSNRIIDNLLNFSRMSGDQLEKVNIHRILKKMTALQAKALSKKQIKTLVNCPKNLEGYINQEALGLVITNLLSNAIDALQNGGVCELKAERNNTMLILICRDTGKGITPDVVEQIFDPFFTTKPRGAGTGLGLYIAYNQAIKLGGKLSVTTRQSQGTTFTLEVPFNTKEVGNITSEKR